MNRSGRSSAPLQPVPDRQHFHNTSFALCGNDTHSGEDRVSVKQISAKKTPLTIDVSGTGSLPAHDADLTECPAPRRHARLGLGSLVPRQQSVILQETRGLTADSNDVHPNKWDGFAATYGTWRDFELTAQRELGAVVPGGVDPGIESPRERPRGDSANIPSPMQVHNSRRSSGAPPLASPIGRRNPSAALNSTRQSSMSGRGDSEYEELGIRDEDAAIRRRERQDVLTAPVALDQRLFATMARARAMEWVLLLQPVGITMPASAKLRRPIANSWRIWGKILSSRYCRGAADVVANIQKRFATAIQPPVTILGASEKSAWRKDERFVGQCKWWWAHLYHSEHERNRRQAQVTHHRHMVVDQHGSEEVISEVMLANVLYRLYDTMVGMYIPQWYLLHLAVRETAGVVGNHQSGVIDVDGVVGLEKLVTVLFDFCDWWTETALRAEWMALLNALHHVTMGSSESESMMDVGLIKTYIAAQKSAPAIDPAATERWQWQLPHLPGSEVIPRPATAAFSNSRPVSNQSGTRSVEDSAKPTEDATPIWIEFPLVACAAMSRAYLNENMEGCHSLALPLAHGKSSFFESGEQPSPMRTSSSVVFASQRSDSSILQMAVDRLPPVNENVRFDSGRMSVTRNGLVVPLRVVDPPELAVARLNSRNASRRSSRASSAFDESILGATENLQSDDGADVPFQSKGEKKRERDFQKMKNAFPDRSTAEKPVNDALLGDMQALLATNYGNALVVNEFGEVPPSTASAEMGTDEFIADDDEEPDDGAQGLDGMDSASKARAWMDDEQLDWGGGGGESSPGKGGLPHPNLHSVHWATGLLSSGEADLDNIQVRPHPVVINPGALVQDRGTSEPTVGEAHPGHVVSGVVALDVFGRFTAPKMRREHSKRLARMQKTGWHSTNRDITVTYHDGYCRCHCDLSLPSLLDILGDTSPSAANAKLLFAHLDKHNEASGEMLDIRLYDKPLVNPNAAFLEALTTPVPGNQTPGYTSTSGVDERALVVGDMTAVMDMAEVEAVSYTFDTFLDCNDPEVDGMLRQAMVCNGGLPLLRRMIGYIRSTVCPASGIPTRFVAENGSHVTLLISVNDNSVPDESFYGASQEPALAPSNFVRPMSFLGTLMQQIGATQRSVNGPRGLRVKPLGGEGPRHRIPKDKKPSKGMEPPPSNLNALQSRVPINRHFAYGRIKSNLARSRTSMEMLKEGRDNNTTLTTVNGRESPSEMTFPRSQSAPLVLHEPTAKSASKMDMGPSLPPSGFEDGSAHVLSPTRITRRAQATPLPDVEEAYTERMFLLARQRNPDSAKTRMKAGRMADYAKEGRLRPHPKVGTKPALEARPKDIANSMTSYSHMDETTESVITYEDDAFRNRPLELRRLRQVNRLW